MVALAMDGLDLAEGTPAAWRSTRLRTQLLSMTAGLWVFCFFSFFAATFLWNNWAPPLWLMAFNAGACVSGALLSLALAQVLIVQRKAAAAQRWCSGFLAVIVFALVQTFVDQQIWRELARIFMAPAPALATLADFLDDFVRAATSVLGSMRLVTYLWLFGMYAVGVELLLKNAAGVRREQQLYEAQQMVRRTQLAALRFQLNPHFLFNTLNAISSLVVLGRGEEAEAMMTRLSALLRTTLERDADERVSLADELEIIEQYLEIEGVRFGEQLKVELDCPAELLEASVPSLILQPLAENAVKHGVARTAGGRVGLAARREDDVLVVTVRNTLAEGDAAPPAGTGVGLANVRNRLASLYGERAALDAKPVGDSYLAAVRLPLSYTA